MRVISLSAASVAVVLAASAHAGQIFSWEDGTAQGWTDTTWSNPNWTDKSIGSFGATDGNFAYDFKGAGAFNFGDQVELTNSGAPWVSPENAARWNSFASSNMLLMDVTVQGERLAPLDPNNGHYIAFWPAFNGPGGGFIGSYNNPADPGDGSVAQYQLVFAPEYYTEARTRTLAWDFVSAGYDFSNLVAVENPPGSGIWSGHFTLIHMSQNSNFAGIQSALDNFRTYRVRDSDPTWAGGSSGSWSSAGSWANGVPNGVDAYAVLKGTAEATSAINLDSAATVGSLVFNNIQRTSLGRPTDAAPTLYTISGTSTLTLSRSTGEASIVVLGGANAINAPLSLASDTVIDLAADTTTGTTQGVPVLDGASLSTQNITLAAGKKLRTSSVGQLTVNGNIIGGAGSTLAINGRKTTIGAGGSRVVKVDDLSVATSAQLDITNNTVIADYDTSSPIAAIKAAIISGYAGGTWNGKGIVSSSAVAAGNTAIGYAEASSVGLAGGSFAGQTLVGDAVLIRYTLKGDTDLNRIVNFDDLLSLAQAYSGAGDWRQGDSNYDGNVNFDDLLSLAQNYGGTLSLSQSIALENVGGSALAQDWQLALSIVPEPTSITTLGVLALATRRRRAS